MPHPEQPVTVCPECHYGFMDPGGAGHEFVCPRTVCGHRWEAISQTMRSVQGTDRRQAVFELAVIAAGVPSRTVLEAGEWSIGRDDACRLVLDNRTVSRRHALIRVSAAEAVIEDLGSACGTMVNGEFIDQPRTLRPGDQLVLGGTTLLYEVRYQAMESPRKVVDQPVVINRASAADVLAGGAPVTEIHCTSRVTIGRAADRDIVLSAPMISARHAVLERKPDGLFLSDDSRYEEYARLRHHIGYVPQDDIIHREPTVIDAVVLADQIECLLSGLEQTHATALNLRLSGCSVSDAADQMGVTRQAFYRLLEPLKERLIRQNLELMQPANDSASGVGEA